MNRLKKALKNITFSNNAVMAIGVSLILLSCALAILFIFIFVL